MAGGTHTLQDRYSAMVLEKLRADTIFYNLFNKTYEGNPKAGAVKIPVRDGEVVVSNYNIASGASLAQSATTYQSLAIDKDKAVNELIDGYEASAVPDNLVADRLDSAGYSMAKSFDDDLVALILDSTNGGTVMSNTTAITSSTAYDAMIDAIQSAKKLGLRTEEMWLAVTNDTYGLLLKDKDHFVTAVEAGGNAVVRNGLVGYISGVAVYETNNIADTSKVEFILGNRVFCHLVDEWSVPVAVRDLADGAHIGASAVQGRRVYGTKISRPTTVLIKKHA